MFVYVDHQQTVNSHIPVAVLQGFELLIVYVLFF